MPIQCRPVHYKGDLSSFKWKTHHKINTSLLMLREWTYTASSRDALGNTSPSALEISLGRGFCTPRPSRFPSGFALGKSLGPRGAKSPPSGNLSGLRGCISQYIPPLGSVQIQYHLKQSHDTLRVESTSTSTNTTSARRTKCWHFLWCHSITFSFHKQLHFQNSFYCLSYPTTLLLD